MKYIVLTRVYGNKDREGLMDFFLHPEHIKLNIKELIAELDKCYSWGPNFWPEMEYEIATNNTTGSNYKSK